MLPESSNLEFGIIENLSEPPVDLSSRFEGCKYLIHCASPVILGDVPEVWERKRRKRRMGKGKGKERGRGGGGGIGSFVFLTTLFH